MTGEGTRYGSRIDAVYKDGHLKVRGQSGTLLDLQTSDNCADEN